MLIYSKLFSEGVVELKGLIDTYYSYVFWLILSLVLVGFITLENGLGLVMLIPNFKSKKTYGFSSNVECWKKKKIINFFSKNKNAKRYYRSRFKLATPSLFQNLKVL